MLLLHILYTMQNISTKNTLLSSENLDVRAILLQRESNLVILFLMYKNKSEQISVPIRYHIHI